MSPFGSFLSNLKNYQVMFGVIIAKFKCLWKDGRCTVYNSSDSASCFLCSFSPGHLDGSGWVENKESYLLWVIREFAITIYKPL